MPAPQLGATALLKRYRSTVTRYDGSTNDVQNYLGIVQPVGWIEELSKLEDMSSARNVLHLIGADSWQVKMRMINRDTVLPRQVS